ncbi:alpha-2-macroglobulin family protein [Salmonella enterica]|nr:alpha-2-macroglobulin family protein [Salmonella enterica]EBF1944818.1 alpha-2-macroglobulin family protein [Salmonella enterica]ECE1060747.1 alpha-2-macroglobulin family protein [Salmonella enterica subsp. enterica]
MKHLRVVACMIMLALAGCDNNDKTAPTTKSEAPAVAQPSPAQDPAQLQKLAQQSQGKALTLLDASEAQLDGAATLVLTFSIPLDPEQDFSRVVHVVDKKSGSVDGAWELAPNLKELRLRHLEPERVLVVTVDPAVKALNNATFGKSYEKTITTRDVQPSVGFASRGSLLPGKIAEGLPVMALNVNHVDVNFFRVKPGSLASFVSQWEYRSSLSNWESDHLLKMADLVYTGRFDLNPARNTREKLLLPLSDIKPLQQAGVYVAVMNQAGHYNYSNAATLFTLSDIGVSAHRYHNRLDIFTQSLENGAAQSGIEIVLLNDKGQTLAQATSDAQGHVQLEADKAAALLLARKEEQTTLLDLTLPALDLSEFNVAGAPGYSKQFFMFGPRDLYRPGETVILNGLLRDSDGKTLPDQPVKLEVVKPDGQVMRTIVSQPENGLYRLNYPLDINAPTGLWHVRANTGDNLLRSWDFHVEDFMPERMALNLTAQKTPLAPADEVKFSVVGYYLYGAPAIGNTLQGQLFLRPLRDAVAALPGFQFGNIAEENLSRSLDEVQLTLDKGGRGEVSAASQWQEAHSPLQVILQASLLESGGRPVTRRVEQAIWPADTLPGIRPQFAAKSVYDYRTDTTVNQPIVDEDSNAAFDIVYANAQGEKKAVSGLQVRLIRERRDYYWNWSESEGWQSQFDQKDLVEGEQTLDLNADETGKVSFPVEWGAYRLEVKAPNETVSSVRFWAGYSWQDNSDGSGAARPDRVTLKLDKASYRPGDTMKLHIAAPVAGKGYAMVESSDGPLWWQAIDVPAQGLELTIPVDKTWNRHDLYLSTLVVRPGDKSRSATPKRAVGLLHLPLGDENRRLDLARYIRELKAYPYGCLEQTASGLFPALYTNAAQLQSLGITGDSDEKRRAAVDIGISRILQMQRDNGGFALWDENGAEEPWLTAYAMDFLIRAGEQGYSVPPEAINRGNERLLRYLQDPGTMLMLIRYSDNTQASTFAAQAYAALVLARQQKAPLGALREIWERRSQAASGLPLMQLGIALNTMGDARRGEEAITLALNTPRQDERQWIADYGSSLRDNALMLSLLEENNLRPDAQNALLSSLSEQAFGQRWLSTQENNALFLAAHSRQASAGAWQAQTSLEAQPLAGDKALTRNLDADQLAALEVTNTGSQPLWLRLDSSGYPSSAPEPASNVLQIERQILGTDGQRKSLSSLRSGELVLVWLTVVADRNVPDALVVDLLPAGLELENQNLADSSASLPESGSEVQNLLNQMQQADIQYMEFRDDRFVAAVVVNEGQPVTLVYLARAVTPGTYQLAQPQVESMYVPQWRATGASEGLLIVTP